MFRDSLTANAMHASIVFRESLAAGSRDATMMVATDGKAKFRRRIATGERR